MNIKNKKEKKMSNKPVWTTPNDDGTVEFVMPNGTEAGKLFIQFLKKVELYRDDIDFVSFHAYTKTSKDGKSEQLFTGIVTGLE